MAKKCYFTFPTVHQALRAEKLLAETAWQFKIVPVPREISSSCGVSLCCSPGEADNILEFLAKGAVLVEDVHTLEDKVSAKLLSFLDRAGRKRG